MEEKYSAQVRAAAALADDVFGSAPEKPIDWLAILDRIEAAAPIVFALLRTLLGRAARSASPVKATAKSAAHKCPPEHKAMVEEALEMALDQATLQAQILASCNTGK